jgi:hypothetical protein
VQALPRQQDRENETFRLQRSKPSLIHLICCTHAVRRAKPTTSGARRKREAKRKTKSDQVLFQFGSPLGAKTNVQY